MLLLLTASVALAGYGDPVEGIPTPTEREVHLWTNAVRVDPGAFADAYPCSFEGFQGSEQTPKLPLLWNQGLGEAARFHSDDMLATGNFSHTSSDGTPFEVRVANFYDEYVVGENIAAGYADAYDVVINGWMCSSGHRANIMLADYDELGTGVAGDYYTQDFGRGNVALAGHSLAMGAHTPVKPFSTVTFMTVFYDDEPPVWIEVVVNGITHPLELAYGAPSSGVYAVELPAESGCTSYFFRAEKSGGMETTFPEAGKYGYGGCTWDDDDAQWISEAPEGGGSGDIPTLGPGGTDTGDSSFGLGDGEDDDDGIDREWSKGCASDASGGAPVAAVAVALGLAVRRRRSGRVA